MTNSVFCFDEVFGFEDFGPQHGKTKIPANHALVFMIRGITTKWKQVLGFTLACEVTKSEILCELMQTCLRALEDVGLQVIACVCDLGSCNNKMISKLLHVTANQPFFNLDGKKYFMIYDIPHLLKCLRNNLLKYDFLVDNKVVSWKRIVSV